MPQTRGTSRDEPRYLLQALRRARHQSVAAVSTAVPTSIHADLATSDSMQKRAGVHLSLAQLVACISLAPGRLPHLPSHTLDAAVTCQQSFTARVGDGQVLARLFASDLGLPIIQGICTRQPRFRLLPLASHSRTPRRRSARSAGFQLDALKLTLARGLVAGSWTSSLFTTSTRDQWHGISIIAYTTGLRIHWSSTRWYYVCELGERNAG